MPHRIFLASLLSILFLLALCLRSLVDANPLSGAMFLGHELWTYKAAIPLACFCASLVMALWGMGATLLRQSKLGHGCLICALPMLICCCFVADTACLPFLQTGHQVAELLDHSPALTLFTLLNMAGGWAITSIWIAYQTRSITPWRAGISGLLLAGGLLSNIPLYSACMAHYYPAWELGLACWLSYAIFLLILIGLQLLYLWSKK